MSARPRGARSCSVGRTESACVSDWNLIPQRAHEKGLLSDFVPSCVQFDDHHSAGGAEDHFRRWDDDAKIRVMRRASSWDRRFRRASTGAIRGRARRRNSSLVRSNRESLGLNLFLLEEAQAELEAALALAGQAKRPTMWNESEGSIERIDDDGLHQFLVAECGSESGSQPLSDPTLVGAGSHPLLEPRSSSQNTTASQRTDLTQRFDVGAVCETVRSVTMRKDESMESEIVHKLRAATKLTVLNKSSEPTGRRICVSDEEGHMGWVSITSMAGLVLIRDARSPGRSWSSTVVGVAQSTATLPLLPVRGAARLVDTFVRGAAGRAGWASSETQEIDKPTAAPSPEADDLQYVIEASPQ